MRTLLSQLEIAKKSGPLGAGEKERAEMESVGGSLRATSDFRSPTELVAAAAVEPKTPDIAMCFYDKTKEIGRGSG